MDQQIDERIDLMTIQSQLTDERNRLQQQIDARGDQSQGSDFGNRNRGDLASDYFAQERQFALRSVEVQKLKQIEDALHRIDEGTYGRCIQCKEQIGAERLAILPSATLCIDCQAK